ncbi:phospholipid carrier-dependent glycosyltransferase [Nocardioidaceae bacterium]|nr:phospholipid carrier-dependent glycosyltransferase [Nocardioidaceae bacterium]
MTSDHRPPASGHASRFRGQGWAATIAVTVLAGVLRVWQLGRPNDLLFDETYYAKHAWSMWLFGWVREFPEEADGLITGGQTRGIFESGPTLIVHPELGKWLIALGEGAFGMDSFGWRISSALVGTLMVLVVVRLARRLTGSTLLGVVAGLLLALDGMALVLSRLALLDIFVAFFLVAALLCLVRDREQRRTRMAALASRRSGGGGTSVTWGPVRGLLLRPWLLAAGAMFGASLACKWSNIFALAAFGLLTWIWDVTARHRAGVRTAWAKSLLVDAGPAALQLVGVAAIVYVLSWTGWLIHAAEYEQAFRDTQYGPDWGTYLDTDATGFFPELVQSLRSLWNFHQDVYTFHRDFLDDAEHSYQSSPWGWLVLERPVGIDAQLDIQPGVQGCAAPEGSDCLRQVLLLGTPAVWWAGCAAAVSSVWFALVRRDWRDGIVVVGVLATWLPWLPYADRPVFSFYAINTLPFLVLALALALGRILGPAGAGARRRMVGAGIVTAYVVLVVVNAGWLWPIWTDQLITHDEWLLRIWFDSWI